MELWIRSQSKQTLMKVSKIYSEDNEIFACGYTEFDERIGEYETKERALQILDEIQDILNPKILITDCGNPIECSDGGFVYLNQKTKLEYSEVGTYVYEMPQE